MKAISLHQPYASLIACGIKPLETRSRAIHYRGEIAVHASKRWTIAERLEWDRVTQVLGARFPAGADGVARARRACVDLPPLGVVVAVAEVTACIQFTGDELATGRITKDDVLTGDCSAGRYGWRLEGVRPLREPLPLVGRQSLWTLSPAQAAEVLARVAGTGTVLSPEERQILEHSLGLDNRPMSGRPYRDHFCANIGSPDGAKCDALAARGLMRAGHTINERRDRYYHVTEAGAVAVGHELPRERARPGVDAAQSTGGR